MTDLAALIDNHSAGHCLERRFYDSAEVFTADRDKAFNDLWHIAGHASRIPNAGDYFLLRICGEEIIVIRDQHGEIHAHYNVCRHRGSRVCKESSGNKKLLVCPYHAWTYNQDGSLRVARLMDETFDPSSYSLHSCRVNVSAGLIFVALTDDAPEFDEFIEPWTEYLSFHGIADANIAKRVNLPTAANWKLVVENFIECYHCIPAHPEYCSVHSKLKLLAAGAGMGSGPEEACREYQVEVDEWMAKTEKLGHPFLEGQFPNGGAMTRLPIRPGFETESRDGKPVAPLMGKLKKYDGGITYMSFNYLGYLFAANDNALLVRFTPISEVLTDVEATWLVDGNAESGKDFDPDEVAWVWEVTLEQDLTITEDNQAGVQSSRFVPGPYSTQENMNVWFTEWYLDRLRNGQ